MERAEGGLKPLTVKSLLMAYGITDPGEIDAFLSLARDEAPGDHRRELGLLLGTVLMRAAGQDWYEQGDIWTQVAAHRVTGHHPTRAIVRQRRPCTGSSPRPPTAATALCDPRPPGPPPSGKPAGISRTWHSRAASPGACAPS